MPSLDVHCFINVADEDAGLKAFSALLSLSDFVVFRHQESIWLKVTLACVFATCNANWYKGKSVSTVDLVWMSSGLHCRQQ